MTSEGIILLVLLGIAFVAFLREVFPVEVTALGLLVLLIVLDIVPPDQAFLGFSNKAVITIGALFVLAEALTRTGILELVSDYLTRKARNRRRVSMAILLIVVGLASGFLNNTTVVAMFIPLVVTLCTRFQMSPSRVLIPLSYVSIFGGTLTLIGTSTNLLVSSVAEGAGARALGMFELTSLGLVFFVAGLTYVFLSARRLLPERAPPASLARKYGLGPYLTEVSVDPESKLIGQTLLQSHINERYGILVFELLRGGKRHIEGIERLPLQPEDHLFVEGSVDNLMRLRREQGLALLPDIKLSDDEISRGGSRMVEGVVLPTGAMVGKTLDEIDFRHKSGGFVLAIRRPGATLRAKIGRVRLRASDSLLILVPGDRLEELRNWEDLIIISELGVSLRRERLWWMVFLLLPLVVGLAAAGLVEIAVGAPVAAVALLLFGVLTPQQAYRSVDWTVVVLIAAFIPVGQAFAATGAAENIAAGIIAAGAALPGEWAPYGVLSLLYMVAVLVTAVVSNNAAAIILVPIALSLAVPLEVDSRPFVMAVCFGASAAFMTPMGYQTNLMVYGPGGYRFIDYFRFGMPLILLFWLLATLLIPQFWPFQVDRSL